MSNSDLVLPYAVEDKGRKTRFSEYMEAAAILCIAEAERKKKSGLFGGVVETLTLLSKLHYPFWAIPWEDNCLLIDGMGTTSDNVLYFRPPEVEAFIEHLKRSTSVHELYHSTLRSHRETFSEFTSQTEIPIDGFITDNELLSDMLTFIKEGKVKKNIPPIESSPLMQPIIDKEKAVKISKQIQQHFNKLQSEIKGFQFAIDTLSEETETHVAKLQQEMEHVREDFEKKIFEVRTEVEKKRAELEKERDSKVEKITATHEKEVSARLSEKKKWDQELLRLEQNKSEYEKRKELRRRKNDEVGEARWDAKLRDVQRQISTVKGKIKSLSEFINRTTKETERTTQSLRDTYEKLMDEEAKKITDLESQRDLEIEKKEREIGELQQETLSIIDKIERLVEEKRERSSTLKEASIQWKTDTQVLIHVPFYLIQYTAEKEKRHLFSSPVIAREHEGLVMKIRKKLRSYSLQSKIGTLLKPRSKALEKTLISFEEMVESDRGVQRTLNQLGTSHNLLTSENFKARVKKGMEELEVEGWIKSEEKAAILDTYLAK